jgi:hypothetical protein
MTTMPEVEELRRKQAEKSTRSAQDSFLESGGDMSEDDALVGLKEGVDSSLRRQRVNSKSQKVKRRHTIGEAPSKKLSPMPRSALMNVPGLFANDRVKTMPEVSRQGQHTADLIGSVLDDSVGIVASQMAPPRRRPSKCPYRCEVIGLQRPVSRDAPRVTHHHLPDPGLAQKDKAKLPERTMALAGEFADRLGCGAAPKKFEPDKAKREVELLLHMAKKARFVIHRSQGVARTV